ncbi:hypothetical protein ACQPW1_10390 [Nocardia sp. CA-128927]|uniref:hypothetical protein n=1 Tax=Nocardia sp. CA-128927 TaxID=3239975 RepID=UPI003D95C580
MNPVERIVRELAALVDEVQASQPTPPDLVDIAGHTWSWWKGNLYRDGTGRAVPRQLIQIADKDHGA